MTEGRRGIAAPRWVALVLLVLWLPVLLLGLLLTVSIVYSFVGAPILVAAWCPISVAWRILRGRSYTRRRAQVGAIGPLVIAGLLLPFAAPLRGDLRAWVAFAGGLGWCAATWQAGRAALGRADDGAPLARVQNGCSV